MFLSAWWIKTKCNKVTILHHGEDVKNENVLVMIPNEQVG